MSPDALIGVSLSNARHFITPDQADHVCGCFLGSPEVVDVDRFGFLGSGQSGSHTTGSSSSCTVTVNTRGLLGNMQLGSVFIAKRRVDGDLRLLVSDHQTD
jgi:hypothetical protein